MDPFTVIATAAAVYQTVSIIAQGVYNIVDGTVEIDENVSGFYAEIRSLQHVINAVTQALQHPSFKQKDPSLESLWRSVNDCLISCRITVTKLDVEMSSLKSTGKSNLIKDSYRAIKLSFKQDKITALRERIKTHNGAMQVIMMLISV